MKEIKLTQGKVALVDDEDFSYLNQFKWIAHKSSKTYYAARTVKNGNRRKYISMHQVILKPMDGLKTDHIDGNGLNNCRNNLRYATHSQNIANAGKRRGAISTFKGVSPLPKFPGYDVRWRAFIRVNGHGYHLGCFATEKEAAIVYDGVVKKHFGAFAKTNF